jgi:hypothetical protein
LRKHGKSWQRASTRPFFASATLRNVYAIQSRQTAPVGTDRHAGIKASGPNMQQVGSDAETKIKWPHQTDCRAAVRIEVSYVCK